MSKRRFKKGQQKKKSPTVLSRRGKAKAPKVPKAKAPKVPKRKKPTVTSRRDEAKREAYTDPRTRMGPRAPQRQKLTAEQFSGMYPEFSQEYVQEMNKRGVEFYLDPTMSPSTPGQYKFDRTLNLRYTGGQGRPNLGVVSHELEHAGQHVAPGLFAFDKLQPQQQREMVASGPFMFPQQVLYGQDIIEQFAYGLSHQQDIIDPAFYGPMFQGGITPISDIWGNKTWETRQRIKSNRGIR